MYDLSKTFELNIQMVKELNKQNKDVTNIVEHITQIILLKKKLTKEIKEQKGKLLIENQIQGEFKKKIEENNEYYEDQIQSSTNSCLAKDEYITLLMQKLKQVEFFVKAKSKERNSRFAKHRLFKMSNFVQYNTELYHKKINLYKELDEIEDNINNVKQENFLYKEETNETISTNKNEDNKIKGYVDIYRKSCRVMSTRIKLLKNAYMNMTKTIQYLNVPICMFYYIK